MVAVAPVEPRLDSGSWSLPYVSWQGALSAPMLPRPAAREWDARTWARVFARAAHIQTDETDPREAAAGPPPAPPWKALPREGAAMD